MRTGLTPEKSQQWASLFGYSTKPLVLSTGIFPRDDPYITGQSLAIGKPPRIAQEYFGRQCRDRSHSGMRHQQLCPRTMFSLLSNSLGQLLDLRFHLSVHRQQRIPSIRGMWRQGQERDFRLAIVAPQTRTSTQTIRQGNGLQRILDAGAQAHPLMTVQQQGSQIEQLLAGQPDRRKAVFCQQLQNQVRVAPVMFLLPGLRRSNLGGMADLTLDSQLV